MRGDTVQRVVLMLNRAATIGFIDSALHRSGYPIGIQYRPPMQMPRGPSNRLNQGSVTPEKPFLVRIEDRHERHLRHVQSLTQQIDADEDIELAQSQPTNDLHAFDCINVGMHIAHAYPHLLEIVGQVFRHTLREGGHQHPFALPFAQANLVQQIIHLTLYGTNLQHRIQQSRGPNHLLYHHTF